MIPYFKISYKISKVKVIRQGHINTQPFKKGGVASIHISKSAVCYITLLLGFGILKWSRSKVTHTQNIGDYNRYKGTSNLTCCLYVCPSAVCKLFTF